MAEPILPWKDIVEPKEKAKVKVHYIVIEKVKDWTILEKFFDTSSPSEMRERLLKLAEKVNKGELLVAEKKKPPR